MEAIVERMTPEDWPEGRQIFEEGIATGNATFTATPPQTWARWLEWKIRPCCLVARTGERTVGWVSLDRYSDRAVYSGVGIVQIYVAADARGLGVASALLAGLIRESETQGIWTLESRIFPENEESVRLHQKHGFRIVGTREKIGLMSYGPFAGAWRDVLLLERRSTHTPPCAGSDRNGQLGALN